MKKFIFPFVLILTFFAVIASAQEKRLDSSPQSFQTFFAKFKKAVEKSDKTAVASMTQFPFKYAFDAGDEGTMTKTQFIKKFNDIFDESPKNFFTETNPMFSISDGKNYVISTEDAAHLLFIKKGKTYKFAAYLVEP